MQKAFLLVAQNAELVTKNLEENLNIFIFRLKNHFINKGCHGLFSDEYSRATE